MVLPKPTLTKRGFQNTLKWHRDFAYARTNRHKIVNASSGRIHCTVFSQAVSRLWLWSQYNLRRLAYLQKYSRLFKSNSACQKKSRKIRDKSMSFRSICPLNCHQMWSWLQPNLLAITTWYLTTWYPKPLPWPGSPNTSRPPLRCWSDGYKTTDWWYWQLHKMAATRRHGIYP